MQQQLYSGGEYAPNSNAYVTPDMQAPQGAPGVMQTSRPLNPNGIPSGYPAYALPGARFPMRGPGPPAVMHGQTYGNQPVAVTVAPSQQLMPMQIYGTQNSAVSGHFPSQATPPGYGVSHPINNPNYVFAFNHI